MISGAMQRRGVWQRTNNGPQGGFKGNTPDGWVDTNGPVWFYGTDTTHGWLNPIDRGQSAGISSVTRATSLIVNSISATPWTAPGNPRWLSDPMLLRPDGRYPKSSIDAAQRMPASVFWAAWIRSALLWGMGWLAYAPDAQGYPVPGAMRVRHPSSVLWDSNAAAFYIEPNPGWKQYVDENGKIEGSDDGLGSPGVRLLALRNPILPPHPDSGVTPGTLAYHAAEMGLIDSANAYATGTFTGAGVPSGYLKANGPMTQEQASNLKTTWMAAHGSARTVAVLNSSIDYTPIAVSPVDAALVEMKRLSLLDVANAFGVPGYMLGAEGPSMTYSNVEMEAANLYEFTLRPWAVAVEETLSALLPEGQTVDVKVEGGAASGTAPAAVAGDLQPVADLPQG